MHHPSSPLERRSDAEAGYTLNPIRRYLRYARSKLCNMLTAAELQRRARGAGLALTTAAVSPGVVATGIWGNLPRVWRVLVRPLARLFAKTPRQARAGPLPAPVALLCASTAVATAGSLDHAMEWSCCCFCPSGA
jgi:NAD(P)-dependent dehydrogenase (short-subunit alcohol dehydrogenase family)